MLSQINYQEKSDKSWNVKGVIISQLFHYLQFVLLLGSSKLAGARMALAAEIYWVKMTELVTRACKKNKTQTTG